MSADIKTLISTPQEDCDFDVAKLDTSNANIVAKTEDDCNNNQIPQSSKDFEDVKVNTSISSECDPTPNESNDMKDIKIDIILTKDLTFLQQLICQLRYSTTHTFSCSFEDYVSNMKHGQKDIYFMIGRSVRELTSSPFVQRVVQEDYEVILMADPILDDRVMKRICQRYNQYRLVAVNSETLQLPRAESIQRKRKRHAGALSDFSPLCKRLKTLFPDDIQKVIISDTLVKDPFVLVPSDGNNDENGVPCHEINVESGKYRLEINPNNHSLKFLCARAAILDKKQEELDSLISFLVEGSLKTYGDSSVQGTNSSRSDTRYFKSAN